VTDQVTRANGSAAHSVTIELVETARDLGAQSLGTQLSDIGRRHASRSAGASDSRRHRMFSKHLGVRSGFGVAMNVVHEATWPDWENIALNLARSARILWEAWLNESPAITANMHADVTAPFHIYAHAPAVMLLCGLSLEAMAKAILTKAETDRTGRATAALPTNATTGHPLQLHVLSAA
jgi:hypothetical protein